MTRSWEPSWISPSASGSLPSMARTLGWWCKTGLMATSTSVIEATAGSSDRATVAW